MANILITHKNKIPLVSKGALPTDDEICFVQRDVERIIGYDNVQPPPYTGSNHYLFVKYKFSSVSTTNVGIKIPILEQLSSNTMANSNDQSFQIWNSTTVNNQPPWGFDNYLNIYSYPPYPPYYYYRNDWAVGSNSTHIYAYTNTANAKGGLNTTDYFWFAFQCSPNPSFYRARIMTYSGRDYNCQLRPYVNGAVLGTIDTYTYIEVQDYNS